MTKMRVLNFCILLLFSFFVSSRKMLPHNFSHKIASGFYTCAAQSLKVDRVYCDFTFCAVDDGTEVKDRGRQISEVIVTN